MLISVSENSHIVGQCVSQIKSTKAKESNKNQSVQVE